MSESFSKLKAMLEEKKTLTAEAIETITKEHGALAPKEHIELEALRIEIDKVNRPTVTMEDYLAATKIMDEAAEGSDEYKAAEKIVKVFEGGA